MALHGKGQRAILFSVSTQKLASRKKRPASARHSKRIRFAHIYVSHASADRGIAAQLAEQLEQIGADVWSENKTPVGGNWARETANALERSDVIVMLISPEWVLSDRAQREFAYFFRGDRFAGRIVPVLVRPTTTYPWILDQLNLIKLGKGRHAAHLSDVVQAVTSAARAA